MRMRIFRNVGSWFKVLCLLTCLGTVGGFKPVFGQSENETEADADRKAYSDFVVSGEDKFKVRSEKILRELFVDMDQPFQELLAEASKSVKRILPDKYLEAFERAGKISSSHMTFSPWISLITKQPILVIRSPQSKVVLRDWKFQISDEVGQVLYSQSGGSSLPQMFIWDGRCSNGRLIDVGESYFYTITLFDKAGNPVIVNSKPRKLQNLAFYQNNRLTVRLLSSTLFDEKIRSRFSQIGRSLMKEACDYVIKDIGRNTQITVQASDPNLGQAQGEAVKEFILDRLVLPDDDFQVAVKPAATLLTESVTIQCIP